MGYVVSLLAGISVILIGEVVLWILFRRKVAGLVFPHEYDASFFRFFTLPRLGLLAFMHTATLISLFVFFLTILW